MTVYMLSVLKSRKDSGADTHTVKSVPRTCQTALPNVDVAFFSDDSADESQLREIMRGIAAKGPSVVVAMRGPKGSMAWDGETFYHQDAIDCVVVDTLGAGDSYIAGFLLARLAGKSMPECMRAGSDNSAVTIGYLGAW